MNKPPSFSRAAIVFLAFSTFTLPWCWSQESLPDLPSPSYEVIAPPPEMRIPSFYEKYTTVADYPIVASGEVNDYALKEAAFLIHAMLVKRADILTAMTESGSRFCILGAHEYTTELPDFAWLGPKDFWDARARGTGGSATDPYCSCGEENLLAYPGDPYEKENILIHEFAHNIHLRGMARVDPTFDDRVKKTYDQAMAEGLWKDAYASVNHHEYFAEGVQSWFNNNRINDHDHNHVNTRELLREYDPRLAELCSEVFRDTVLDYTKPLTRLTGHLEGYDPSQAPTFKWPERLTEARTNIKRQGELKSSYERRDISGWSVWIHQQLFETLEVETNAALDEVERQLNAIVDIVPEPALTSLRNVPLWLSLEYPDVGPRAEYHPSGEWLRENDRNPAMARGVEFTNIQVFEEETIRMPWFILHELAHAYHHQILGFDHPEITEAFDVAVKAGRYEEVKRWTGKEEVTDRAYALTDPKEYFAEASEAYFGRNDFEPFTREELREFDPVMEKLIEKLWNQKAAP